MLDIVSVGSHKVAYKDHKNVQFESLAFYTNLAEKTISKFAPRSISKQMLKSEDAVSSVANAIMMADWRWDENRTGSSGQKKTPYSYRNQCAIWAIKSYISRKNTNKHKHRHIDNYISKDDDLCILDILEDKISSPLDIAITNEQKILNTDAISALIDPNSGILSERQCEYIRLYYLDGMTFAEIGKRFSITREAVRQGLNKAIDKLQQAINNVLS